MKLIKKTIYYISFLLLIIIGLLSRFFYFLHGILNNILLYHKSLTDRHKIKYYDIVDNLDSEHWRYDAKRDVKTLTLYDNAFDSTERIKLDLSEGEFLDLIEFLSKLNKNKWV